MSFNLPAAWDCLAGEQRFTEELIHAQVSAGGDTTAGKQKGDEFHGHPCAFHETVSMSMQQSCAVSALRRMPAFPKGRELPFRAVNCPSGYHMGIQHTEGKEKFYFLKKAFS